MTISYSSLLTSDQPPRRVLAYIREGNTLKSLVSFRGTTQRGFYEVVEFEAEKKPLACFRSMEDAVAFATRAQ
jgi:hypothetical protein